jgi:dCMP deaminase
LRKYAIFFLENGAGLANVCIKRREAYSFSLWKYRYCSKINKMIRPGFDEIFMNLATDLAKRSHCVKAQVGAVLAKDTRIISIGYNGPPAGTHNCDEEWPESGCPRDSKNSCSLALHAEENAILYAVRNGALLEGSTLYTTLSPCISCARLIFSSGIKRVYYKYSYAEYKGLNSDEGVDFLNRFGVLASLADW